MCDRLSFIKTILISCKLLVSLMKKLFMEIVVFNPGSTKDKDLLKKEKGGWFSRQRGERHKNKNVEKRSLPNRIWYILPGIIPDP